MMNIPAASIDDLSLHDLQSRFPSEAAEIVRIGDLLASGGESREDLVHLARLLKIVGQGEKAEELLRHNVVDERDLIHRAYIELFGRDVYDTFSAAIANFSDEFSVLLSNGRSLGFLKAKYSSHPKLGQRIEDPRIASLLQAPSEIEFNFESDGTKADITSNLPELFDDYVILQFTPKGWKYVSGSTKNVLIP
jgi:hypothetical protein